MAELIRNLRIAGKRVTSIFSAEHLLALADQAVVSGTSFMSTLLIARFSDATQLGNYAIGISVLVSIMAFQDSLILQPFTIQRLSTDLPESERTGASLVLSCCFSAGSVLIVGLAAWVLRRAGQQADFAVVIAAITAVLPFVLTREFVRRVAIARLQMGQALVLDFTLSVTQLCFLTWLGVGGRMSAVNACLAIGAASAVTAGVWLVYTRFDFTLRVGRLPKQVNETWSLGKWLLMGRMTVQVQNYVVYWTTIILGGAEATGVFAACMSIIGFINPLIFAFGNVMAPKLVLHWRSHGGPGLKREAVRSVALVGGTMVLFLIFVVAGGERAMEFLYPGAEYARNGPTLIVLALATLTSACGVPASFGLATMERPRAIAVVGSCGVFLSVVLVSLLTIEWGLLGAACGMFAGNAVGAIARWVAFLRLAPDQCDKAGVVETLRTLWPNRNHTDIKIRRIGGGEQADAFLVASGEDEVPGAEDDEIVVKLYRPGIELTPDRVQAQFNSLAALHAAFDTKTSHGWTVLVPRPLSICKSPLAIIMTAVPGQYLDFYLAQNDIRESDLGDAARAFAGAMRQGWSRGRRHGDLGLRNVLFDIPDRTISLIDAGTRESCRTCSEVIRFPSAAASDSAHILCDVVRDAMSLIQSHGSRGGKEQFAEDVLFFVLSSVAEPQHKHALLYQVWSCFEEHLAECFEPSWRIKGISHYLMRRVAISRARAILRRVSDRTLTASGEPDLVPCVVEQ